jgi:hypothetical protein
MTNSAVEAKIDRALASWFYREMGSEENPLPGVETMDCAVHGTRGGCFPKIIVGDFASTYGVLLSSPDDLEKTEIYAYHKAGFQMPVHWHPSHEKATLFKGSCMAETIQRNGTEVVTSKVLLRGDSEFEAMPWVAHTFLAKEDSEYLLTFSPALSLEITWLNQTVTRHGFRRPFSID